MRIRLRTDSETLVQRRYSVAVVTGPFTMSTPGWLDTAAEWVARTATTVQMLLDDGYGVATDRSEPATARGQAHVVSRRRICEMVQSSRSTVPARARS
jgi:hypothetical protein